MVFHALTRNLHASVLLTIILIHFASTSSTPYNFTIAKPNCVDRCGNISIPYPFGTTQECSRNWRFFGVRCNDESDPPKLLWANSSIEFSGVSFDGHARVLRPLTKRCSHDNFKIDGDWISLASYFTLNDTANKFTMVSCGAEASVSGRRIGDGKFRTGCTTMCETAADLTEGSCMGMGCCQTSIPRNVWRVEFELRSSWNKSDLHEVSNCSYAFVVEEGRFNFSVASFKDLDDVGELPMMVDWVIDYGKCVDAEKNATSYACISADSVCYEPENGYGYRCRCRDGYEGNPYLAHGCQDIDECADITRNECIHTDTCTNTAGNYTCSCDKGYFGHGKKPSGCQDIDECGDSTLNDCMKKATCENRAGGYYCTCPKGYSGSGRGRHGCNKQDMKIVYIVIGVAFGVIFLLLASMLFYLEHKRRSSEKTKHRFFLQNGGVLLQEKLRGREGSPNMMKIFTSAELRKATDDFHPDMIIGGGGFGIVYKGVLPEKGVVVAIKKSRRVDPDQNEQFINEVFVLSQVNHRNVVRFLGCCLETEAPLLVYEFVSNGTLSAHLHNSARARLLNWETRLRIGAETAGVLAYLHSEASTPIIHRDVKSDNILLDPTFTAKVCDFGASKLVPLDQTQVVMTIVLGTLGYLDPEYMQTHQLTEKSDVYSFGVVLVELLTGRMAISNNRPEEERNLVNFFLSILNLGRLIEILDGNIMGDDENVEEMLQVARLAKECLCVKGEDRPSMKEVAMELQGFIIGGKEKWGRNVDNHEEMESLLEMGQGPVQFANSLSLEYEYDSIN